MRDIEAIDSDLQLVSRAWCAALVANDHAPSTTLDRPASRGAKQ
ncbi:hypothetical protein [Mycobacterium sp. 1245499.0]|nr:hypothetical protein [Mycobacterium sp. 1245499.0]